MLQLSATRCSCIAILWVSLASFAAITICVASQQVLIVVYFVIDSVRKLLDTLSYITPLTLTLTWTFKDQFVYAFFARKIIILRMWPSHTHMTSQRHLHVCQSRPVSRMKQLDSSVLWISDSIRHSQNWGCYGVWEVSFIQMVLLRVRSMLVPGIILLQASYLFTYRLMRGFPSKYSPWTAMHSAHQCYNCWKHFRNSCCGTAFSVVTFFECLQYPEIFTPLRQTLLFDTLKSHSDPNQGNRVSVPFQ
jgi:hypothetical protein